MKTLSFPDFFRPFPSSLLQELDEIRKLLEDEYSASLFVVGGAVRDRLLGRAVTDLDLETYGLDPEKFDEAMGKLGAKGVGKSFFVYKYGEIDIALPRRERKTGIGHRAFFVEPEEDPAEASRRRDFTVNALMYDLSEERILDYWGGLEDLELRRLRCVDSRSFVEDSLRVLRAMRFAAQLDFRVEEETCRLCREIPLDDLPGARIFGEFERMFRSQHWGRGFYELLDLEIALRLWKEEGRRELFFSTVREMIRCRSLAVPELRDYTFLAIYGQHSKVPMTKILDAIDAPNRYRKQLERLPKIPEKCAPSFVGSLARKEGVKASVLGAYPEIRGLARKIGVWEKPLESGVTPTELMARGFQGEALGEELERHFRRKCRELDRSASEGEKK